jgi:LytS/YehU family sensor histidine kinase
VREYIIALSRSVRYMFAAGFHTVPIVEEIRHVENYIEMQELKYPGCVFCYCDLPSELERWKIPQMLIHTIIENEYKYAVSVEKVLTVLIKISTVEFDGDDVLLIEIEDDGDGYPREVLALINGKMEKYDENGERVGLRSLKRMMELMYGRNDLIEFGNTLPHGCFNRIRVPKKAKRELGKDEGSSDADSNR